VRDESRPPGGRGFRTGRWHSRVRGAPEARSEFPVAALAEEIEEAGAGQIRAMITIAGNPVLSTPNGQRLDAALASLDFMVSIDPYLNETTRHADVILPPPSPLERSHYDLTYYRAAIRSIAKYSPAVFPAEGPSEAEILAKLAALVGGSFETIFAGALRERIEREVGRDASPIAGRVVGEIEAQVDGDDPCERIVDFLLRTGPYGDAFGADPQGLRLSRLRDTPHGIDFGPMQPVLPAALETPSGKIELAPPPIGEELKRLDARLRERPAADLLLVGRRHLRSNNSWMHNLPSLATGRDRCTLWMHPEDSKKHGLEGEEEVEVISEVGRVVVPLERNDAVARGVVSLPHGYGHRGPGIKLGVAGARPGASANDLTEGEIDLASGNAVLNGVPVRVLGARGGSGVRASASSPSGPST
jgi:anaerobic selenocysteine-containing dehydrogenase